MTMIWTRTSAQSEVWLQGQTPSDTYIPVCKSIVQTESEEHIQRAPMWASGLTVMDERCEERLCAGARKRNGNWGWSLARSPLVLAFAINSYAKVKKSGRARETPPLTPVSL
ncbi:unnamed protein product [Allacma fusca]|uniref:Uncharacterized protein n=1 Tax=Allacma fusca TaxID=39272 RepID=A0A8J2J1A5_9HEXA|nr:unnamed protein product [Allacma fusca]